MAMKRSVKILWRSFIIIVIAFNLLLLAINYGLLGYMPSMEELENPQSALSSEVYAGDGTLLGRYFVQDRSMSDYNEISPNVINALVSTEDERYYEHSGIDPIATVAIPYYMITGKKRGSSTITQQLAKNLFPRENQNKLTIPILKLKEWLMAVKLERNLTKNEIITLYLNTVPFGEQVYGIRNAALTFYSKTPDKLTVDEAAVLVGILKGNTYYSPRVHPDRALARRNVVLGQMLTNNKLSRAEADELMQKPLGLKYRKQDHSSGMAPYFRQVLELEVKRILKDFKKPDGTKYNIYKDGLKIYTTIDTRMQTYAEQAVVKQLSEIQPLFSAQGGYRDGSVWKNQSTVLMNAVKTTDRYLAMKEEGKSDAEIMEELKKPVKMKVFAWNETRSKDTVMSPLDSIKYMKMFVQAGFMAMDPMTGEVKAWVGGANFDFFKYDHVNINTKRQVGSTIKPLLYCLAVDNGYSPCGTVSTAAQKFAGQAKLYDAGGSKRGAMSMKAALAASVNNAALYLLNQVGMNAFADFIAKCGITSKIEKFPSMALGVSDISLFEMLGAYTMFPSGGMHTEPIYITKIEDRYGNLLKSYSPSQKEIISNSTAAKMVRMMQGVVDFGTAKRLRFRYNLNGDIAGKTGTTNGQADAWFIGYTPQLLAGAWVGCDDRFLRFRSEALGQGAAAALPIWAYFMQKVYADKSLEYTPDAKFVMPEGFNECGGIIDPNQAEVGINYYGGNNNNGGNSSNNEEILEEHGNYEEGWGK